jgi:hypothetical protein
MPLAGQNKTIPCYNPFAQGMVTFGGAEGIRTPDPLNAIQVLSQLSYSPTLSDIGE